MTIAESLRKILESERLFGSMFYDVFFTRSPEARKYFDGVDMKRQALVLTMALQMMEQFHTNGYAAIDHYLRHIGHHHHDRDVPRELYADWRDSLLVALEQFLGADWSDDLRGEWERAIASATTAMFRGYDEPIGI
jgi:hemoglobin-like flavoprotein